MLIAASPRYRWRGYHQFLAIDQVDQSVFLADPPGPGACEYVAERPGLADPGGRVAQGVIDQLVESLEVAPVG